LDDLEPASVRKKTRERLKEMNSMHIYESHLHVCANVCINRILTKRTGCTFAVAPLKTGAARAQRALVRMRSPVQIRSSAP